MLVAADALTVPLVAVTAEAEACAHNHQTDQQPYGKYYFVSVCHTSSSKDLYNAARSP